MHTDMEVEQFVRSYARRIESSCCCRPTLDNPTVAEVGASQGRCPCSLQYLLGIRAFKAQIPECNWGLQGSLLPHLDHPLAKRLHAYAMSPAKIVSRGHNLLLTGDDRQTRTALVSGIGLEILYHSGYSVYYTNSRQWRDNERGCYQNAKLRPDFERKLMSDFLIFEDLTSRGSKDAKDGHWLEQLCLLFEQRMLELKPIIFSTSLPLEDVVRRYRPTLGLVLNAGTAFEVPRLPIHEFRRKGFESNIQCEVEAANDSMEGAQ